MISTRNYLSGIIVQRVKVKRWIYLANINQKKEGMIILISDKDFKAKKMTKNRERHYIMTKRVKKDSKDTHFACKS